MMSSCWRHRRFKLNSQINFFNLFLSEVESRTQGSRPRPKPRTQKNPRPRTALSRPRTGMLEAKAKDQEHSRKCFPKKGLQKSFSGDLRFIAVPRIFDWGRLNPQITCYDVIKNFQKRKFLWGKDIVGCRGAKTRGGWGDISPQYFDCFPPNNLSMVYICIPSNNLTLVCIWAQVSPWIRGKKGSIQ